MRKASEFRSEPFSAEKNLGIPFRIIFGREKKLRNSVPNNFWKRKNYVKSRLLIAASFAEFRTVSFRVTEWTLPKYLESHGMSSLFRRIKKNCSESIPRNFFGTKFRWQPYLQAAVQGTVSQICGLLKME
jgi:hypothetical protein